MAKQVAATGPVEGPWALPDGWRWERLGDLVSYLSRGRSPSYVGSGGVRIINQKCVRWTGLEPQWAKRTSQLSADKLSPDQFIQEFDVLWNSTGTGTIGRASLVEARDLVEPTVVDTHVTILRSKTVVPQWLHYWLAVPFVQNAVTGIGSTNQVELARSTALAMPVPFPSADAQCRISARIDELFAEIDEGEAALAQAREDLAIWRKALLKAAVTGELTAEWRAANPPTETGADLLARILAERRARWNAEPKNRGKRYKEPLCPSVDNLPNLRDGWVWASFDQLVDQLSNGISAQPAHVPPGIPILRISSVRPLLIRDDQRRWLPADFPVRGAVASRGALLFSRYNGNPALVGVCGRYRGETPIAYPDKVMCATLSSSNDAVGDFVELAMNAGASRKHISTYTKTSAGQHGVAGSTVKSTPVPIPAQDELERIVHIYRSAALQADDAWSDADNLNVASNSLRQSILAAAFRGELA